MTTRRTTQKQTLRARDLRKQATFPERVLWGMLRAHRLGGFHFRRQYPARGFFVDFASPGIKLVVELDGMSHIGAGDRDDRRTILLESDGWRVIRYTNDQALEDRFAVAEDILRIAQELALSRSKKPPSRPPPSGEGKERMP